LVISSQPGQPLPCAARLAPSGSALCMRFVLSLTLLSPKRARQLCSMSTYGRIRIRVRFRVESGNETICANFCICPPRAYQITAPARSPLGSGGTWAEAKEVSQLAGHDAQIFPIPRQEVRNPLCVTSTQPCRSGRCSSRQPPMHGN
jgi:hypothetical protein